MAVLVRDASRRSGITAESGYNCVELDEVGPAGDPWLRNTTTDASTGGAGSAIPNERSDGQMGGVPLNSDRVVVWFERFMALPNTTLDRWQIIGPEIHGPNTSAFPQALLMLEVGPDKRRRLNANAGRSTTRYRDIGPIEIGRTYAMKMRVRHSAGADGLIVIWRDGVEVVRLEGPTIHTAANGSYWKEANYRNASINGTTTHDFSSLRIWDGDVEFPSTPTPPTTPADTTPPDLVIEQPTTGVVASSTLPFRLRLPNDDASELLVGITASGFIAPGFEPATLVEGALDLDGIAPGSYWLWALATDEAGNETARSVQVNVEAVEQPPDPPADPCESVRDERDAAVAALAVAEQRIVGALAALTD